MIRRSLRHLVTALVLLVAFVCQGTWALAGTTGGLTGTVLDAETSAPIAGAQVTATSPSQSATDHDRRGAGILRFSTLAPDTYTVTAAKSGYQVVSVPGQIVFADTVQTVSVRMLKALRTIAHVTADGGRRRWSSPVRRPTSTRSTPPRRPQRRRLGGGGLINSGLLGDLDGSGCVRHPQPNGYYATVNIRGGDYDQVGYEFDGVPVNRSFDNYASSSASSLGNAEVQVYTGANPGQLRGPRPLGLHQSSHQDRNLPRLRQRLARHWTPAFYHRAAIEIGGATPDRLFSYYVGVAGCNQAFNYVNNNNGSEYDNWLGPVLGIVGSPLGYGYGKNPYSQPFAPGWSLLLRQLREHVLSARPGGQLSQRSVVTGYQHDLRARHRREPPHRNPAPQRCRTRRRADALGRRSAQESVLRGQRYRIAVLHRAKRRFRCGVYVRYKRRNALHADRRRNSIWNFDPGNVDEHLYVGLQLGRRQARSIKRDSTLLRAA